MSLVWSKWRQSHVGIILQKGGYLKKVLLKKLNKKDYLLVKLYQIISILNFLSKLV